MLRWFDFAPFSWAALGQMLFFSGGDGCILHQHLREETAFAGSLTGRYTPLSLTTRILSCQTTLNADSVGSRALAHTTQLVFIGLLILLGDAQR